MSLTDALHADCKRWPGTQESLSRDVCGSAQGLRHKIAGYKGSVLGLHEALTVMQLTGGRATVCEFARELGGVFVQLPQVDVVLDNTDLMSASHEVTVALGALFAEMQQALVDERIESHEREQLERLAHRINEKVVQWLQLSLRVFAVPEDNYGAKNEFSDVAAAVCGQSDSALAAGRSPGGGTSTTGAAKELSRQDR